MSERDQLKRGDLSLFFDVGHNRNRNLRIRLLNSGQYVVIQVPLEIVESSTCAGTHSSTTSDELIIGVYKNVSSSSNASVRKHLVDNKAYKFLLCVRFDNAGLSENFARALERFYEMYGSQGVDSMLLVIVLDVDENNLDQDITRVLVQTSGYGYLREKRSACKNEEYCVPFCVWQESWCLDEIRANYDDECKLECENVPLINNESEGRHDVIMGEDFMFFTETVTCI